MGSKFGSLTDGSTESLAALNGETVAIDGHIMMHQFLHSITDSWNDYIRNSEAEPISHLIGFLSRMAPTLDAGVQPIVVFDGGYPELKEETVEKRHTPNAVEDFLAAKEAGNESKARRLAHAKVRVTDEMVESATVLLEAMGIPVAQAIAEGEPQCAQLVHDGLADHVVSTDWDTLLYNPPTMLKDFTTSGFTRITLADVLASEDWSLAELQWYGILLGTDYNASPVGVGPTYAKRIVNDAETFDDVIHGAISYDDSVNVGRWLRTLELIQDPSVKSGVELSAGPYVESEVVDVAVGRYGLNKRQVMNYIGGIDTDITEQVRVVE